LKPGTHRKHPKDASIIRKQAYQMSQFIKYSLILTLALVVVAGFSFSVTINDFPRLPPVETGNMYVSNYGSGTIGVYDSTGAYLRSLTPGGMTTSRGIVFGPDDHFYVASQNNDEIFKFDLSEQLVTTFSAPELDAPTGMAISPDNKLYVGSFNNDNVAVFDLDGTYLRSFAGPDLNGTNCVAFDSKGYIYVSSALNAQILKFDASENYITSFTGGGLLSPMSIARDNDDLLYTSGGSSNNIVVFDTTGTVQKTITHQDLAAPQGVAFDERGHMFSSSFSSDLIVEFDTDGNYVQTITAGDMDVPRSIAFLPMETTSTSVEESPGRDQAFTLAQSFPNPFSRDTAIRFSTPLEGAHVRLSIYDLQGRLITTLANSWYSGGSHELTWDGTDTENHRVSRGLYLYELQAGDVRLTRKMVRL